MVEDLALTSVFADMLMNTCPEAVARDNTGKKEYSYKSFDLHCKVAHVVWKFDQKNQKIIIEYFEVNTSDEMPESIASTFIWE